MTEILEAINMILSMCVLFVLFKFHRSESSEYSEINTPEEHLQNVEQVEEEEDLTDLEKERIARDNAFELRIESMKQELANQRKYQEEMRENVAYIGHPGIQNLPHNIIADDHDNLPDVEITL